MVLSKFEIGPNLFASVMGTGIVSIAALSLPSSGVYLRALGTVFWLLATSLLVILTALKLYQFIVKPEVIRKQLLDPVMSQFFGAPPMAFLTVAGGFILFGNNFMAPNLATSIAWLLWAIGTVLGMLTANFIPYLLYTFHKVRSDAAFGGWLMPVVPPMVSASIGGLLIPTIQNPTLIPMMLYTCYGLFGMSLISAFIIITMIWSRLAFHGSSGGTRVPTLWIILGPIGQSITVVGVLGPLAETHLETSVGASFNSLALIFGVPVWGFAMYWLSIVILLTIHAYRLNMRFGLTWWAFTFPVGTCVTGTIQIAHHSGALFFYWVAYGLFVLLFISWLVATAGTVRGIYKNDLLAPNLASKHILSKKRHSKNSQ